MVKFVLTRLVTEQVNEEDKPECIEIEDKGLQFVESGKSSQRQRDTDGFMYKGKQVSSSNRKT